MADFTIRAGWLAKHGVSRRPPGDENLIQQFAALSADEIEDSRFDVPKPEATGLHQAG